MSNARVIHKKVNDGVRPWITIGAELDPRLSLVHREERSAILSEASGRYHLAPRSLLNIVKAFRYVRSHAKSIDMPVDQVRGAALSIDVLMRIEKKSPRTAMDLRLPVFRGDYSYRELLKIESDIDQRRVKPVFEQVDWNAFSIELSYDYFSEVGTSWAFGPDRAPYSDVAKLLGVDLEVKGTSDRSCLFLTPRIAFSEHRGQALEIQIPKVFAATFFYDRIIYILWDNDEVESFAKWHTKSKAGEARKIEVLHRSEVLACRCFGDDVLEFGPGSELEPDTDG